MSLAAMKTFRFMDLVGGRENGRKRVGKGGSKDTNELSVTVSLRSQTSTHLKGQNTWPLALVAVFKHLDGWHDADRTPGIVTAFFFCTHFWVSYGSQMCPRKSSKK